MPYKMMRHKSFILYFLFIVSSVAMVGVPAFPHHHHHDGTVCMKGDVGDDCCEQEEQEKSGECTSSDGCIALDNSVTPSQHQELTVAPHAIILFMLPLHKLLLLADDFSLTYPSIYIESLHGTLVIGATGLRAPPFAA
jgi:hypothetical protein